MPISSILTATTKDNHASQLITLLNEVLSETRAFPGCISMNILQSEQNPNEFVFSGEWEAASDYENYLSFRTNRGDIERLSSLLVAPSYYQNL